MITDLFVGGIAGIVSRTTTAPLELYKIQQQSQYLKGSNMRDVIKKEGFRHLWKGNMTNCIRVFPQFALNYATFESSKKTIFSSIESDSLKNFYSGGVAGAVSMVSIYPLETIRTRLSLQMNKSHYTSPWQVFKMLKFKQLYKGVYLSVMGGGTFSALNFMFYYNYKKIFEENNFNPGAVKLLSGGLSGMSSITFTYPTDLLRKHLQMEGFNDNAPKYKGVVDGFKTIIRNDGFLGLYRGLLPAYARCFSCLSIQFWCLEQGKQLFK